MLNNLPNVTQLVRGGAGIQTLYDLIVVLTHRSLMKRAVESNGENVDLVESGDLCSMPDC